MLATEIKQIETEEALDALLAENEAVMLCCGRNGPMCLPVYDVMEKLEPSYQQVAFRVMAFDGPVGHRIRSLPETRDFMGLPFTIYYKGGKVVAATSSIQNKNEITAILDEHFAQ